VLRASRVQRIVCWRLNSSSTGHFHAGRCPTRSSYQQHVTGCMCPLLGEVVRVLTNSQQYFTGHHNSQQGQQGCCVVYAWCMLQ